MVDTVELEGRVWIVVVGEGLGVLRMVAGEEPAAAGTVRVGNGPGVAGEGVAWAAGGWGWRPRGRAVARLELRGEQLRRRRRTELVDQHERVGPLDERVGRYVVVPLRHGSGGLADGEKTTQIVPVDEKMTAAQPLRVQHQHSALLHGRPRIVEARLEPRERSSLRPARRRDCRPLDARVAWISRTLQLARQKGPLRPPFRNGSQVGRAQSDGPEDTLLEAQRVRPCKSSTGQVRAQPRAHKICIVQGCHHESSECPWMPRAASAPWPGWPSPTPPGQRA